MFWQKSPINHLFSLSLAVSFGLVSSLSLRTSAATPIQPTQISQGLDSGWNAFDTENDGNSPGRRVGGATRGSCPIGNKPLTAIVPESELGRTVEEYPSIFLYVPSTPENIKMEFELQDKNDNVIYKQEFLSTGRDGIYRIDIPSYVTPLEAGENYVWSFSVICSESDFAGIHVVGGIINRIEDSRFVQRQIQQMDLSDRPAEFTQELLWYDLMASLADLRESDPNNPTFQTRWEELLMEVGLEDLADEPLN
jgi:hypothetical protein